MSLFLPDAKVLIHALRKDSEHHEPCRVHGWPHTGHSAWERLPAAPAAPLGGDVGAVLLGRSQRLFYA